MLVVVKFGGDIVDLCLYFFVIGDEFCKGCGVVG